jgi:hypothetical protein
MVQHGKFIGKIEINGSIERCTLYVFMPDECLSISDVDFHENGKHHKQLLFSPCTRGMLLTHNADELSGGRYFELSGTNVGTFNEGRSAPYGEGEFDCRRIQALRLDLAYFVDGIAVTISGATLPGSKVTTPGQNHHESLPPWHFKIQFDIPRSDFKELFALNDLGLETLNHVYDQYAKRRA